jgi:hypothetical protein
MLSLAWGFLSSTWISPWMTVLSQISLPRCSCPSLDSFGMIYFSIERSMFLEVVSCLGNLALNLVGADLLFPEIFASIS